MRLLSSLLLLTFAAFIPQIAKCQQAHFSGELIVQTKAGIDIHSALTDYPSEMGLKLEQELSQTMRAYQLSFDTLAMAHDEVRILLSRNDAFSVVQNNHRVWLRAVPNDPTFGSQWHHRNTGQSGGTPDADIDADEAWDITTGGNTALGDEIVVCIIEGVNMAHPDLIDNRWQNSGEIPGNGIDDDGNGYIDDIYGWNVSGNNGNVATGGHGTNVAGMIGAKGNNNLGVAGVNWNVKIMVVSGHNANSEANIIACYDYPLTQRKLYDQTNGEKGAFVVSTNASWGIDGGNPASVPIWCAFYDTLGTYGILNCGATTNSNLNVDVAGDIPTACASPYMVGVGRSDRNDGFAGGYGVNTIDFAAPGINVWTTDGNNGYTSTTGTSFASPLTAGAIALLYSVPCEGFAQAVKANPQSGSDMVLEALLAGVDVKPALIGNFITGGRLNVNNSLHYILDNFCPTCLSPVDLVSEELGDDGAELNWLPVESAVGYTVFYREVGETTWQQQTAQGTSLALQGLDNCGLYEFYVQSSCAEEVSTPSAVRTFSLLPYCETAASAPAAGFNVLTPSNLAGSYQLAAPTWGGSYLNTTSYGQLVLANDGTANPTLGCNALVNAAAIAGNIAVMDRGSCEFGTKALNAQNAGAVAAIIINNTGGLIQMGAGAQSPNVTIPAIMITQADGNALKAQISGGTVVTALLGQRNEWIQSISVGSFSFASGNDGGYAYHHEQGSISLIQGSTGNVNILPSALGAAALPQRVRVWLDADQNGTFSPAELLFDQNGTAGSPVTGNITVPANAMVGKTRLRVQTTGSAASPDVCGGYSNGETEDYCAIISELSVGLKDLSDQPLSVIPNPTGSFATIGGLAIGQTFTVLAADGRLMLEGNATASTTVIDVSDWPKGTFIIRVLDNGSGLRHTRLIVL